jgi:glycosyltransferase involved in cell wall biosynthesis
MDGRFHCILCEGFSVKKRSVLQLCPSAAWGGAETVADTLRAECERAGWDARLEVPFEHGNRWSAETTKDHRIPWWRWALRTRPSVDVVHAHLPWPDRVVAAIVAARGKPLVVTFQLLPEEGKWPNDRCVYLPSHHVLRAVGALRPNIRWVALSRADARRLEAHMGVAVHVVRNAPAAPSENVRPLEWPGETLRVLSVGRVCAQKGFDRMVRALAHPTVRTLPWHWNIIGEGSDRTHLHALIDAHGLTEKITLCGSRPATDGLANAQILLSPSRFEGMPLVPMEGAEASVPVLASTIDSHVELYENVIESLLPEDETQWPSVLVRYFTNASQRDSLCEAQKKVLGDNPRRTMYTAYETLYHQLMA